MYKKVLTKGCTKKYFSYYRGSRRISKKEYERSVCDKQSVNNKRSDNYKYKNLDYFEKLDIIKNETLDEYKFEEHIYIQVVKKSDDILFLNIPDCIKNSLNIKTNIIKIRAKGILRQTKFKKYDLLEFLNFSRNKMFRIKFVGKKNFEVSIPKQLTLIEFSKKSKIQNLNVGLINEIMKNLENVDYFNCLKSSKLFHVHKHNQLYNSQYFDRKFVEHNKAISYLNKKMDYATTFRGGKRFEPISNIYLYIIKNFNIIYIKNIFINEKYNSYIIEFNRLIEGIKFGGRNITNECNYFIKYNDYVEESKQIIKICSDCLELLKKNDL